MSLRDKYLFLQQLGNGFSDIGAVFPTGGPAARSLCSEVRRTRGPKRILEVGCGTGPVTEALIRRGKTGQGAEINVSMFGEITDRPAVP